MSRLHRLITFAVALAPAAVFAQLPIDRIRLPAGFTIGVVARAPGAREMTFGAKGTLFVGSNRGDVYAITLGGDGADAKVRTIASGLRQPVGVAFRDGAHGWKFIAFGPDGKLYVPVGAPCNICEPDRDRYANIMRTNADGSGLEVYARGIRNTVGFDWDPVTKALWFTNNGRDNMGDDVPPDTLAVAPRPGVDFGYPYCHAGNIPDPEYGRKRACSEFAPPAQRLGAHVAALGMRFCTGSQFPAQYRNQIFIAEHGSWNRSSKVGYRVTLVRLDADRKPVSYEPFAEGWLQGQRAWGRPADVANAPDGALLIADDDAGAIYRVRYHG
jgi:glucose/arabinose dehydrogenase